MSIDEQSDIDYGNHSLKQYSKTKNIFGVKISKAKPVGTALAAILTVITLYSGYSLFNSPTVWSFFGLYLGILSIGLVLYLRVSERWAKKFNQDIKDVYNDAVGNTNYNSENYSSPRKTSICRECRSNVSPDVDRCPECGWKPKKRGGLWWGATAVMFFNPIGWALAAKGASDNRKASKGVTKEIETEHTEQPQNEEKLSSDANDNLPDTLERLNELKTQGAITEAEFEEKKKELLDRI